MRTLILLRKQLIWMALLAIVLPLMMIVILRWFPPPSSAFMLQRQFTVLSASPCERVDYQWQPWAELSLPTAVAVIAAEDQHFPEHFGFDVEAIVAAIKERQAGKRIRGASTISQQVAKNLFLWSGQSWLRKGIEVWLTGWIELVWPKQRILEVYLNIAQFGACLYGVQAAAQQYFNRNAKALTRHQSALLAAVLPNPVRYQVARPSGYIRTRQRWILKQMRQLGGVEYLQRLTRPDRGLPAR